MTITEHPTSSLAPAIPLARLVALDLYRDVHKGIRAELFAVTGEAARLDPADRVGAAALAQHVDEVVALLVSHAEHEDTAIAPSLEAHLPDLAAVIAADHEALEPRMDDLRAMGGELVSSVGTGTARLSAHRLHLALASFTGVYLVHQDTEESVVMPALEEAVGIDVLVGIHEAIVSSIPPDEMARSLALMLPAMSIDDRAEMLGGMAAGAPPEVFAGVWSLAGSVLAPADHRALAARLGLG